MTTEELKDYYYDELKWCGCGEPWTALKFLGDVLTAIDDRFDDEKPYSPGPLTEAEQQAYRKPFDLVRMDTAPGLAYGYLYMLDALGLTEHGSTIRGCWLTDQGRAVKEAVAACSEAEWEKASA